MSGIIPVLHCFNDAYVIPAAVSFYSMLEHADASREYRLYVLHSDISEEHRKKLQETISPFKNATLEFIDMKGRFEDLFSDIKFKAHYSKEMFYKFLAPSLFPQYDKMMITDVDVVWMDDIAPNFDSFDEKEDCYLAGCSFPVPEDSWVCQFSKEYEKDFSEEELKSIFTTAGGYWIFNLKKMRKDKTEEKFIETAKKNVSRVHQPEQDCVNLICSPKIRILPLRSLVCTYLYDIFSSAEKFFKIKEVPETAIKEALKYPIQLHYAGGQKPWNDPCCEKSQHWFSCLAKTPFFQEQMDKFMPKPKSKKTKVSFKLFSLLPVVSVVQKAGSRKFRFFGLPVLKIRDDGVFLFCFLKIGKLSQ